MATFYFSKALKFLEISQVASNPSSNPSADQKANTLPWGENFAQ